MPLSTFLADGVRELLARPDEWRALPDDVREWLDLQTRFSAIPGPDALLVEHFFERRYHTLFYTFAGRKANQTLGMLVTRRMEHLGLKPLSFQITDYGLVISGLSPIGPAHVAQFLAPDILGDELEEWILDSRMLKRSFRHVATVTGLVDQQYNAAKKTMRQMTVSTDLIYDVLRRHEPDHILLAGDAARCRARIARPQAAVRAADALPRPRSVRGSRPAVAVLDPGADGCAHRAGARRGRGGYPRASEPAA